MDAGLAFRTSCDAHADPQYRLTAGLSPTVRAVDLAPPLDAEHPAAARATAPAMATAADHDVNLFFVMCIIPTFVSGW
jgi:hypothetical protein